jgi:hypothetical protein
MNALKYGANGNTTSYDFSGALFNNVAAYLQAGNNTFCLYNPSPSASGQGYSYNYLQWSAATLYVTYEEGVSQPRASASSVDMGTPVTIYTDRLSTSATHTLSYSFGGTSGQIASGVGDSVLWTPPLTLAQRIPSSTSGLCTITCDTYYAGVLTGTKTCSIILNVPASVVPTISSVSFSEAVSGIAAQFAAYVQNKSKLAVSITASNAQGSTITTYRATLNGTAYTASSFTTNVLSVAGDSTLSITVTDSRGRTATTTRTISVLAYAQPTISLFKAERCNSAGSAPQMDGNRVRISAKAGASSVGGKNTMTCKVFYKLSSATAWTQATTITPSNYSVDSVNLLLPQTFDVLASFDLMVRVQDFFHNPEQSVSIGTKQVMLDFFRNGTGIAFGKVAETAGAVELGWPLVLAQPLGIPQGGTGADNAASACSNIGAVKKAGDTMTGNLSIQGYLYPSVYLMPTYNGTTNRTVFEGSYVGASSFAAWEDSTGNNRRMLEVRTAAYEASMDNAVLLRTAVNGTYYAFRIFHSGMATPIPVGSGGTGANNAKAALTNLGIFYSATLPSSGTDGQICLVPVG